MDLLGEHLSCRLGTIPSNCNVRRAVLRPTTGLEGWNPPTTAESWSLPSGCSLQINSDSVLDPSNELLVGSVRPPKVTALFKVSAIRKCEAFRLEESRFLPIDEAIRKNFPTVNQSHLSRINKHVWIDDEALSIALRERARTAQFSGPDSGVVQYAGRGGSFEGPEKAAWPVVVFRGGSDSELGFGDETRGSSLFVSELGADGRVGVYRRKIPKERRLTGIRKWVETFVLPDGTVNRRAHCKKAAAGRTYCFSTWKYKYYLVVECRADVKSTSLFLEKIRGFSSQGGPFSTVGEFACSRFYASYLTRCHENACRLAFRFSKCVEAGIECEKVSRASQVGPVPVQVHLSSEKKEEATLFSENFPRKIRKERSFRRTSSSSGSSSSSSSSSSSLFSSSSSSSSSEEQIYHRGHAKKITKHHVVTVDPSIALPPRPRTKWSQVSHLLERFSDEEGDWVMVHGSTVPLAPGTTRLCLRLPPLQGYAWVKLPKKNCPVFAEGATRTCAPAHLVLPRAVPDRPPTLEGGMGLSWWDAAFSSRAQTRGDDRRCRYCLSNLRSRAYRSSLPSEEHLSRYPPSKGKRDPHRKYRTLLLHGTRKRLVEAAEWSPVCGICLPSDAELPTSKEAAKALEAVFLRPSDAVRASRGRMHPESACAIFQNLNPAHCTERETGFVSVMPSLCGALAMASIREPFASAYRDGTVGGYETEETVHPVSQRLEERSADVRASFDEGTSSVVSFSPVVCVGSHQFANFV